VRNGNGRCGCKLHADPRRIRIILNHVFIRRELPGFASVTEKALIVGKLVRKNNHGNGRTAPTYRLTGRGEGVLMSLYERRTR
jgi:hypothetical protein